ncbi:MAG: DUF3800 domain-containing protein [bacterium]|nr:DUF3800 domain-containing protein [bacterium]
MKYEIYCDESQPDVFWSKSDKKAKYLVIGGLWLPAELRQEIKAGINELKKTHGFNHEIKWHKVHAGKEDFYRALIDLFVGFGDRLRFRCIVVEAEKVNLVRFHQNDKELGFYKFYYQLIKNWIYDFNEYRIFCDEKTNRVGNRLEILRRTLDCSNMTSQVTSVQALPSKEVALIQLADFLVGMISSRMNETIPTDSSKDKLIAYLEHRLGKQRLGPTWRKEPKFNIFKIDLRGGW